MQQHPTGRRNVVRRKEARLLEGQGHRLLQNQPLQQKTKAKQQQKQQQQPRGRKMNELGSKGDDGLGGLHDQATGIAEVPPTADLLESTS